MAQSHLCGSVGLDSAEEVFRIVADVCGDSVARIPDGETGPRRRWIGFQHARFAANPALEAAPAAPGAYKSEAARSSFRLKAGYSLDDLTIDLGYADVAMESYATFAALKRDGVIAPQTRFQVSLPTRMAMVLRMMSPEQHDLLSPAFDETLRSEVERIAASIPHDQLAIQWDVAIEFMSLEGLGTVVEPQAIFDELIQHASFVPDDIPVGYHLCYGDSQEPGQDRGHHFVEPKDMSRLVEVANAIVAGSQRPIAWFHMPVPIERDDDAYYAPLAGLRLGPETKLYLGLVHDQDGLAGTQRRIEAAARVVKDFGVAAECGLARKPREVIRDVLEIQRDAVVPS